MSTIDIKRHIGSQIKPPLTNHIQIAELKIRPLTQDDLSSLEWDGEYIHFRRLYSEIFQNVLSGKALMWGADLPINGVVGQLFVQLDSRRKDLADGVKRAYIYGFRVRPAFRGNGIGSQLLQSAELDLIERGVLYINLNVARNNRKALRFYERYGYRVVAAEPGRWFYQDHLGKRCEVIEPAWRMRKKTNGS